MDIRAHVAAVRTTLASQATSISPDVIERWSKWGLAEADRIEIPRGTLSQALERIARTDESVFLLDNVAGRGNANKALVEIAYQPEPRWWLTQIQPYGKPSKICNWRTGYFTGRQSSPDVYTENI